MPQQQNRKPGPQFEEDLALGERTTAGVSYTGQFGDGVSDNGVKGRFTWLF